MPQALSHGPLLVSVNFGSYHLELTEEPNWPDSTNLNILDRTPVN